MSDYNEMPDSAPYGGLAALKEARSPDLIEKLQMEKAGLEVRLAEVSEALAALKANPELEKVFRLVSKVSFRL